uniref:Uncharacterized protein n=1 Tax=Arundo donax TaxID=35708 RepID=A0A0A9AYL5_ARUDO
MLALSMHTRHGTSINEKNAGYNSVGMNSVLPFGSLLYGTNYLYSMKRRIFCLKKVK